MKKIYLWLKRHIKCWNEGHDWYYSEYADYWFCKRCKKATKIPNWLKEGQYMATYCGECPFFKWEDTYGYGICDISGFAKNCSLECSFRVFDQLTNEQAFKVFFHILLCRRGAKIGMPPPALLGLAIDKAIRVLRQKIKEEK